MTEAEDLERDALAPGLHYSLPMADYVADPCAEPSLSASTVRLIVEKSPLAAWRAHPRLGGEPRDDSSVADIGSAAHSMVLEGADIIQVVAKVEKADGEEIVPTAWATKDAKAARKKIRSEGRIPLLPHEAQPVYAMAKAAGKAIEAEVGKGSPEVSIVWRESNGIWCRARADWLPDDRKRAAVNYKTTKASAEPNEFIRRTLFSSWYDVQAAFYLRGLAAVGEARPEYKFLVQEQDPPHDYSWIGLETGCEALDIAGKMVAKAIKLWGECLESGKWPGYRKHTHYADPPAWRAIQFEDSELAETMARETFGGE